jgi:4'-phosphopantetheinyl transferase
VPIPTRLGWVLCGAGELPRHDGWLSTRERAVLAGLAPGKLRLEYRLGRFAAKQALARWLGLEETRAAFAALEVPEAREVALEPHPLYEPVASLSLSHRASLAIAAVGPSGLALGCDLELIEPRGDGFLSNCFRREEVEIVRAARVGERDLMATVIWSAKGSALKAHGDVLRANTRDVAIPLCDRGGLEVWHGFVARRDDRSDLYGLWRAIGNTVLTLASAEPFELQPLKRAA